MVKKIIALGAALIMCLWLFTGCIHNPDRFTEEEHIQRVSERIESKFMDSNDFTDFKAYPLFTDSDTLGYFLIEFEPYGFLYVRIKDKKLSLASGSMYSLSNLSPLEGDARYSKSPYNAANIEDETRYLLHIKNESGSWVYITAVKREVKYINLTSMAEVVIVDGCLTKGQATANIRFIAKGAFNL